MKRFTTKIVLLSLPILFAIICLEIALRCIPNDYKYKKKYLDINSDEIETLILGSSHAYFGIDPRYFSSKTFNASYVSQSFDIDFAILSKYHDNLKNLKTVVIPVSYFTLFSNLSISPEAWRIKKYAIYYGINLSNNLSDYSELSTVRFRDNFDRLRGYYIKSESFVSSSKLGWGTSYNSENALDLTETGRASALRHRCDLNLEIIQNAFKENLALLDSIQEWCVNKNVKIILITPPAYETYRNNLNIEQLNLAIETANAYVTKFDNCNYYNFINDSSFTAKDFYDGDHLSEIGAKKLSTILSTIIEYPENYESIK